MTRILDLFYPNAERSKAFFTPELLKEFQSLGDYRRLAPKREAALAHPAYEEELYKAEIIVTGWGSPLLPADLASKGQLKYVCNFTGEMRRVVPRTLIEQGVMVTNWGNSISRTVAEASLMMILACLRRVKYVQDEMHLRKGYTMSISPDSLFERTVGLFGLGSIARELVSLLKPFQVKIQAYSPHVSQELMQELGVHKVDDLRTLFATSDVISVHAARTPQNMGIINRELLQLLPDDGVLVNTARGAVINEDDLIEELRANRLWVALDVYQQEPLPADSPFRGMERVLLFPHQAGPTNDRFVDVTRHAIDNIRRYLAGEPLVAQVTCAEYDRMT